MRSSYKKNNYDKLFRALVDIHKPQLVVECGVLDGYSLFAMSLHAQNTRFYGIDLFEDYEFKSNSYEHMCSMFDILPNVTLIKGDAFKECESFKEESIDLLHIDLSNTADVLEKMFELWTPKIKKGGLVVFEGGSPERDEVEWMKKYKKTPIRLFKNTLKQLGYEFVTLLPYPSLTICRRGLK